MFTLVDVQMKIVEHVSVMPKHYDVQLVSLNNLHAFSIIIIIIIIIFDIKKINYTFISSGLGIKVTSMVLAAANTLLETALLHKRLTSKIPPISINEEKK